MEIEQTNWSKTLLNTYSYLETICGAIDKCVVNCGVSSGCSSNSTILIANKMISLIERKKFLINLKILIDNVLRNIASSDARILTIKYIDKVKSEVASQVLGLSNRTYFRKINVAVNNFALELKKQGYTSSVLKEFLSKEGWIIEIYNSYSKKEKATLEADYSFLNMALKSISKRVSYYGAI